MDDARSKVCLRVQEDLDRYAEGALEAARIDHRHLADCSSCAAVFWQAGNLRKELADYRQEIQGAMPDDLEDRLLDGLLEAPPRRTHSRRWWTALGWAASLILVFLSRSGPPPPADEMALNRPAVDLLDSMVASEERQEIHRYLSRTHVVLFSLLEQDETCLEHQRIQIARERRLAQDLLFRKRLLDARLKRPENADMRKLCDELELVLLEVASSGDCVTGRRIGEWKRMLESRSTLMRLHLLQRETV